MFGQANDTKIKTTALWLFDEQQGVYPSSVLNDSSPNDYPLVLGPGGEIVHGKFGNALEPLQQPKVKYPKGEARFGLKQLPTPADRTVPPLSWMNADFCAFMTMGEKHLRKDVGFKNPTKSKLNLGDFDWTVEFWFMPVKKTDNPGVVFEIGEGPRGENNKITSLTLNADLKSFTLFNQPGGTKITIPTNVKSLSPARKLVASFCFRLFFGRKKTLSLR